MKRNEQILAALGQYISNEKDGYGFYQLCASRTADQRGQDTFKSLAADELEHIRKLQTEHDSMLSQGDWLSLEQLGTGHQTEDQPIFPTSQLRVSQLVKPDATDLDALQVAIQLEKDSYADYDRERQNTNDPKVKEVFSLLADEELRHLETLESTYTYLAHTGEWFQVLERPTFEG